MLINLWFLVPFISNSSLDLKVFGEDGNLHLYSIWTSQMFQTFNGYDGINRPININEGEMPLSIGVILLFGCVLFMYSYYRENRENEDKIWKIGKGALMLGVLALFFANDLFPWEIIHKIPYINPIMAAVQFPWRYLAVSTVFLCIPSGIGIFYCINRDKDCIRNMIIAVCIICFCSSYYLDSIGEARGCGKDEVETKSRSDSLYFFTDSTETEVLNRVPTIVVSGTGDMEFHNVERKYTKFEADIIIKSISDECYIEIPLYWYPGYTAVTDTGEKLAVSRSEFGMVYVPVPLTDCHLTISYEEPILWKISNIISLLTIAIWIVRRVYIRYSPSCAK